MQGPKQYTYFPEDKEHIFPGSVRAFELSAFLAGLFIIISTRYVILYEVLFLI